MDKKELMMSFFKKIKYRKLMTNFLINIFDYQGLHDYNYIYRIQDNNDNIIIDVYDNISANRFNRYIFSFNDLEDDYKVSEKDNVFVTVIGVFNIYDCDNKLIKFANLFRINKHEMIDYARTFLEQEFVKIISEIIK